MAKVSVIISKGEVLEGYTSFDYNAEHVTEKVHANNNAEGLYTKVIKKLEPNISNDDIQACVENGYYDSSDGSHNFNVFLSHELDEDELLNIVG